MYLQAAEKSAYRRKEYNQRGIAADIRQWHGGLPGRISHDRGSSLAASLATSDPPCMTPGIQARPTKRYTKLSVRRYNSRALGCRGLKPYFDTCESATEECSDAVALFERGWINAKLPVRSDEESTASTSLSDVVRLRRAM